MEEEGRREEMIEVGLPGAGASRPRSGRGGLRRHELSVVRSDLRGFTAFSETSTPEAVIELLRDYYATVAAQAAAFGATIKEHAGDGTLVLVGALEPAHDHAERAVALALGIMTRAEEFLAPRRGAGASIGLGVGVASGVVTVGTIEAGTRVEAIAVGGAVNLASRLCARAGAGQILVAERTLELVRGNSASRFERIEEALLKGFTRPVPIFQALRS